MRMILHTSWSSRCLAGDFLAELVREYLKFQGFEHTAAVFEPEAMQVLL